MEIEWIDQYTGTPYRITTEGHHGGRGVARVKTYGDVFEEYEWHPESKCADVNGEPVGKQTIGLLHRRHITIDHVISSVDRAKPAIRRHFKTGHFR